MNASLLHGATNETTKVLRNLANKVHNPKFPSLSERYEYNLTIHNGMHVSYRNRSGVVDSVSATCW